MSVSSQSVDEFSLADSSFEDNIEMREHRTGEERPLLKKRSSDGVVSETELEPIPRRAPIGALPRVDEADDEDDEDPLLEVMDRIEDEVDGTMYDDLVPFHVKLALEENVFGWSHLASDIFGHIMFTAGYYLVAYIIITQVCWKRTPESDYELRWGMSEEFFRTVRFFLSFLAGLSGFRTVRRRRKVWLRAPYGTPAYEMDGQRRQQLVEETDRTTLLGRIRRRRDGWLARRVQRKLFKASGRFEKKIRNHKARVLRLIKPRNDVELVPNRARVVSDGDQSLRTPTRKKKRRFRTDNGLDIAPRRRMSHTGPTEIIESVAHDQVLFEPGPILNMPYAHGGFFGAAPFMLANPYWIDILRHLMPDVYVEISRRVVHAPASKLIHWAENNPVVAAYGTAHELEYSGKIPNIEWDVFLDPHLVQRVEVVLDERDKFLRSCARQGSNDETEVGRALEAAAVANMSSSQQTILRYYNAEIRRRTQLLVDRMLIAHGNLTQLMWEQTGFAKKYNFSRVKRTRRTLGGGIFARQWLALYAEALKLGMHDVDVDSDDSEEDRGLYTTASCDSSTAASSDEEFDQPLQAAKPSLQAGGCSSSEGEDSSPFPVQMKRCTSEPSLVSMSSIRDMSDSSKSNDFKTEDGHEYERKNSKSLFDDPDSIESRLKTESDQKKPIFRRGQTTSLNALAWSKCPDTSITKSISMLKSIMQCNAPIGLFLDVKSRHVSKRVWALIAEELREAGARVEGIASFYLEDIRGISSYCATPVKEVIFFHSAGDLQQACHDGRIQQGDTVLFNGGSLLWEGPQSSNMRKVATGLTMQCLSKFDAVAAKRNYKFLPFARISGQDDAPSSHKRSRSKGEGTKQLVRTPTPGMELEMDGKVTSQDRDQLLSTPSGGGGSTIQYYKERFGLSIGLYCQEFAIDEAAINMLVKLVNDYPDIYDLGLSWGGVNGITVRDIQPGRFTETDGYWNQRYAGASWDPALFPPEQQESISSS